MRIKKGFVLRTICGESIVVGEGVSQINFNKLISLNESAAWLFNQVLDKNFTEDDIVNLLQERYDVTTERAVSDTSALISKWKQHGIIEED